MIGVDIQKYGRERDWEGNEIKGSSILFEAEFWVGRWVSGMLAQQSPSLTSSPWAPVTI